MFGNIAYQQYFTVNCSRSEISNDKDLYSASTCFIDCGEALSKQEYKDFFVEDFLTIQMNSEVQTWDETKQAIKEEKTPDEIQFPLRLRLIMLNKV